jgi:hypothetical protein
MEVGNDQFIIQTLFNLIVYNLFTWKVSLIEVWHKNLLCNNCYMITFYHLSCECQNFSIFKFCNKTFWLWAHFAYIFLHLFTDYLKIQSATQDYTASNGRMINEQWIENEIEGSSCCLIWGTILAFASRDCEENNEKLHSWQLVSLLKRNPSTSILWYWMRQLAWFCL